MIREHLSNEIALTLSDRDYQQEYFKPRGIWYQVNDSWLDWVKTEMPHWLPERYKLKYELNIDFSNVLVLDTEAKMIAFSKEYIYIDPKDETGYLSRYNKQINWPLVAQRYDGIEIAPYFWQFRMHDDFGWYYAWDVASGCIWNTKAIKSYNIKPFNWLDHYEPNN